MDCFLGQIFILLEYIGSRGDTTLEPQLDLDFVIPSDVRASSNIYRVLDFLMYYGFFSFGIWRRNFMVTSWAVGIRGRSSCFFCVIIFE